MVASRLSFFRAALLRHRTDTSSVPAIRLSFSPSRLTFSSASVHRLDTVDSDSTEYHQRHPWPEWMNFVDHLKTKGYFNEALPVSADDDIEMKPFMDACISFARDRFDVFKSLSRKDIQTVAGGGCPNIFREAVNSAKRYVMPAICEDHVTEPVVLKESEAAAHTVDIVRILLFYALDPLVTLGEKPPGRELAEVSARKLLSELIELSHTPLDPALAKPGAVPPLNKEQQMNFTDDERPQNVKMKKGDWICPKCNFMNFSRNRQCLKCSENGPKRESMYEIEMKEGDWTCLVCNFMNFSRNIQCLKCRAERPKNIDGADIPMKKGDWNCPRCEFMNFASRTECLRCRGRRPLYHGEWECPICDFLNYRSNAACHNCGFDRPQDGNHTI